MKRSTSIMSVLMWTMMFSGFFYSCEQRQLDEYGGYYDEQLQQYVYVKPGNRTSANNSLGIDVPKHGKEQSFEATVIDIADAKSIWIKIDDRQGYMLLSQKIIKSYKNDKHKALKIVLKYVKPGISSFPNRTTKKKWLAYVKQNLGTILHGKPIVVQVTYLKPGILKGLVFMEVNGKKINVALWMISEGLSVYFKEYASNPEEDLYIVYQQKAKLNKKGLWKQR